MSCSSQFNNDDNNNNNNNNNYIPSFYGDMPSLSRQQLTENASHIRAFGAPHTFTFSHPTQGSTIPTPRPSIQTTSSMPYAGALGPCLGTTWQHSNPVMINSTSSVYTGMPVRSDPQPSCSSPVNRPKRKALEDSEDAPSSKVYLCTDQFANLNLNTEKVVKHEKKGHDLAGWGRFQEVENSIEYDVDEENPKKGKEGVLRIDDTVTGAIASNSSTDNILPRRVLKEIAKPCMQVVLWKSPGELVRDLVKEDSLNVLPSSPSSSVSHSLSSSATSSSLKLSSTAFDGSSKFMSMSNHLTDSHSSPSSHVWLPANNCISPLSFSHRSPVQVPVLRPTLPQKEWDVLSPSSSLSSPSSSLLLNKSKSSTMSVSQGDPAIWGGPLDLNFSGNYDEEMQL